MGESPSMNPQKHTMVDFSNFNFIDQHDKYVERWIKELTETERQLTRLKNDLEVESAKEKLLMCELQGKLLKLEQFITQTSNEENNRLRLLMYSQLREINRGEVLANINNELKKQRDAFLKDIAEYMNNDRCSIEVIASTGEDSSREHQNVDAGDKGKLEEDIARIEGKIAEAEKEHQDLKLCLAQHQELLDELKGDGAVAVVDEGMNKRRTQNSSSIEPQRMQDSTKPDNSRVNSEPKGMKDCLDFPSIPTGVGPVSNSQKKKSGLNEASSKQISSSIETLMTSKGDDGYQTRVIAPLPLIKSTNTNQGTGSTQKRTKLGLYEIPKKTVTFFEESKGEKPSNTRKGTPTFKPKKASFLRNMIN